MRLVSILSLQLGQNRTEQNGTERKRTEQSRAEQSRTKHLLFIEIAVIRIVAFTIRPEPITPDIQELYGNCLIEYKRIIAPSARLLNQTNKIHQTEL